MTWNYIRLKIKYNKQIILLSLLRCQSSIFSMNYLLLLLALLPLTYSLLLQSGCKNKTIFPNHQIKYRNILRYYYWLNFGDKSLLTFSKSHKKKDCKFITLFFNQQIKYQLYFLILIVQILTRNDP